MSEHEHVYPSATRELAAERKRLAPKPAEAFKAFTQSVFAEGALPVKTKQLIAVARGARDAVPVLHPRTYQRRPSARCDGGRDHGSHLGRRGDACRWRIRTFGFGTGYDRARSDQEKASRRKRLRVENGRAHGRRVFETFIAGLDFVQQRVTL